MHKQRTIEQSFHQNTKYLEKDNNLTIENNRRAKPSSTYGDTTWENIICT